MKIEQLLVQYFYNTKEVTLQGIGTFILSPDFVMPKESDKDVQIPDNAISFRYNHRALEDEALINFIAEQSGKMKPLASADLDSYLALCKQFLNIGKPFKLEGLGILLKNQQGDYAFTQGTAFAAKPENSVAVKSLKEDKEEPSISFASKGNPSPKSKKGLLIAALIISACLISSTIWYFFIRKNNNTEVVNIQPRVIIKDSVSTAALIKPDSLLVIKSETPAQPSPYTFKVVIMVTPDSAVAAGRMRTLITRNHTVIMYKKDSLNYSLAEPFTLPLSDTTRVKDSLNSFYYSGRAFIELK